MKFGIEFAGRTINGIVEIDFKCEHRCGKIACLVPSIGSKFIKRLARFWFLAYHFLVVRCLRALHFFFFGVCVYLSFLVNRLCFFRIVINFCVHRLFNFDIFGCCITIWIKIKIMQICYCFKEKISLLNLIWRWKHSNFACNIRIRGVYSYAALIAIQKCYAILSIGSSKIVLIPLLYHALFHRAFICF